MSYVHIRMYYTHISHITQSLEDIQYQDQTQSDLAASSQSRISQCFHRSCVETCRRRTRPKSQSAKPISKGCSDPAHTALRHTVYSLIHDIFIPVSKQLLSAPIRSQQPFKARLAHRCPSSPIHHPLSAGPSTRLLCSGFAAAA